MKPLSLRTYAFKAMFYIIWKIIWNDIYQLFTILYAAFGVFFSSYIKKIFKFLNCFFLFLF